MAYHSLRRNDVSSTRFGPSFFDNKMLLESGLGLLMPVSSDIGLDIRLAHSWTMERSLALGLGLVINL